MATTRPKTKKLYNIEGHIFSSKVLFELYKTCIKAQKEELVSSFDIRQESTSKSKYPAFKPVINGITFDSALEADFYIKLLFEKARGNILDFELQVTYELQPKFVKNGQIFRPITYTSDFDVIDKGGNKIIFDTKGDETEVFRLKHKLFEYKYPELSLKVIRKYAPTGEWMELKDIKKIKQKNKLKKNKEKIKR